MTWFSLRRSHVVTCSSLRRSDLLYTYRRSSDLLCASKIICSYLLQSSRIIWSGVICFTLPMITCNAPQIIWDNMLYIQITCTDLPFVVQASRTSSRRETSCKEGKHWQRQRSWWVAVNCFALICNMHYLLLLSIQVAIEFYTCFNLTLGTRRRFKSTSGERPSSAHCAEAQGHAQREKPSSKGQQGTHHLSFYTNAFFVIIYITSLNSASFELYRMHQPQLSIQHSHY